MGAVDLSIFRNPAMFRSAVAMVPATNLFQRLAWKGIERVDIEEDMQLVDALRSRKPAIAETMVSDNPPGGHTFDRRVDPKTWQPEKTREQRDSWNRVWTFLDWNLDPFHAELRSATK